MNTVYVTDLEALPREAWRMPELAEYFSVDPALSNSTGMLHMVNIVIPADDQAQVGEFLEENAYYMIEYDFAISTWIEIQGVPVHMLTLTPLNIYYLHDSAEG